MPRLKVDLERERIAVDGVAERERIDGCARFLGDVKSPKRLGSVDEDGPIRNVQAAIQLVTTCLMCEKRWHTCRCACRILRVVVSKIP